MADGSLLPGEQVILQSNKALLTLTNARVLFQERATGASRYLSITLDAVASCGLVTRSYPLLLALGALAAIAGIMTADDKRVFCFATTIALAVLYAMTRAAVIKISSNGGEAIVVPAKGMPDKAIREFLHAVDEQKMRSRRG